MDDTTTSRTGEFIRLGRLSRRRFMQATGVAGAGLVVAWSSAACGTPPQAPPAQSAATAVPSPAVAAATSAPAATAAIASAPTAAPAAAPELARRTIPKDVDSWLHVDADGSVGLATGKVEFGQGIQTAFAQLVAEELDVPFNRVTVTMGITDRVPYDIGTFGSLSMRTTGVIIRQAAAEMRQWLHELGAAALKLPVDQVQTKNGAVVAKANPSQSVRYADLAAGKKSGRTAGPTAPLKDPDLYTIVGQSIPRVDVPAKVTGGMKYGYDTTVPGMAHGKVVRPPSWGATLQSVDFSQAQKMPGVVGVFRDGDFAGLAAERHEQAEAALAAVKADWRETGSTYTSENIFDALKSTKDAGRVLKEAGDVGQAMGGAAKKVTATVRAPYLAHAQIEPMTALVHVQPDKAEVWTSTQSPFTMQDAVAQVVGMAREKVVVYPQMSGGAFGRKNLTDAVTEAARLSKAFGRPVRVNWTRQEEFQFDHFRPAMLVEVAAGLDGAEDLVAWDWATYAAAYFPEGATRPTSASAETGANALDYYAIPNARSVFYQSVAPLPPEHWRANGAPVNALARETVLDELAELAGTDPVSFRERLLQKNPRLAAVMRAVVSKAKWQPGKGSTGRGYGLALDATDGTHVAEVAQVHVDTQTGAVRVQHVDAAIDCGLVVNPGAATCQVEGSIVMQGTSSTLKEGIRFAGGKVLNPSFAQYAPLTIAEAPTVDVVFVEDKRQPMQGLGEPAVGAVSAAISNAIYDAVGVRLRDLPFTPDKVLAALKAKHG